MAYCPSSDGTVDEPRDSSGVPEPEALHKTSHSGVHVAPHNMPRQHDTACAVSTACTASPSPAHATTVLKLRGGILTLHCLTSGAVRIPCAPLRLSGLLQDIIESSGDAADIHVPVPPDALLLWLHYVRDSAPLSATCARARAANAGAIGSGCPMPASCSKRKWLPVDSAESGSASADDADAAPRSVDLHADGDISAPPIRPAPAQALADSDAGQQACVSGGGHPDSECRLVATYSIAALCSLMVTADVLIDEDTKTRCASTLATHLLHRCDKRDAAQHMAAAHACLTAAVELSPDVPPRACEREVLDLEAIFSLPQALQMAVLSALPLSHCLTHLPAFSHPLALRAHHPSIDASRSLQLPLLPVLTVPAALRATAALSRLRELRDLSLDGVTMPPPDTVHACTPLLAPLTDLTSLSLRDIGIREPTAEALASVLPMLRLLRHLDLSSNLISSTVMCVLAPALARCSALHTLNLWDALSPNQGDADLDALAAVCRHSGAFAHLTTLAVGCHKHACKATSACEGPGANATGCDALVACLRSMPGLKALQLDVLPASMPFERARALAGAIAQCTGLRRLHLAVPRVHPLTSAGSPVAAEHLGGFEAADAGAPYGMVLRKLTCLTSLELNFTTDAALFLHGNGPLQRYCRDAAAVLAELPSLSHLQCLVVHLQSAANNEGYADPCQTLASVLPTMQHLRQLRYHFHPHAARSVPRFDAGGSLEHAAELLEACHRLPSLQEVHMPVTAARGGHERLINALLAASSRLRLSIDLLGTQYEDALDVFAPVFQFTHTLSVTCYSDIRKFSAVWAHQGAFRELRELAIHAYVHSSQDRQKLASRLLTSLPLFTRLQSLQCVLSGPGQRAEDDGGLPGGSDEVDVCSLTFLRQLTHLGFLWPTAPPCVHKGVLHACARLPQLRSLDLGDWTAAPRGLCADLLPTLRLKTVIVDLEEYESGWGPSYGSGGGGLGATVGSLPHLRCLRVPLGRRSLSQSWVEATLHPLAAFQCLC